MSNRIKRGNLQIDINLDALVSDEIVPGLNIEVDKFWNDFELIVTRLGARNRELLEKRDDLQKQINNWHSTSFGPLFNIHEYEKFLRKIDYIVNEGDDFKISTSDVDDEIAKICGPQLVVPLSNARFVLNAVNAR